MAETEKKTSPQMCFYAPSPLGPAIREQAKAEGMTKSEWVRAACRDKLEKASQDD